jgi:hypothetical protein
MNHTIELVLDGRWVSSKGVSDFPPSTQQNSDACVEVCIKEKMADIKPEIRKY